MWECSQLINTLIHIYIVFNNRWLGNTFQNYKVNNTSYSYCEKYLNLTKLSLNQQWSLLLEKLLKYRKHTNTKINWQIRTRIIELLFLGFVYFFKMFHTFLQQIPKDISKNSYGRFSYMHTHTHIIWKTLFFIFFIKNDNNPFCLVLQTWFLFPLDNHLAHWGWNIYFPGLVFAGI